jgi:phospholipase C
MDGNDARGRFVSMGNFAGKLAKPGFNEQFIFIEPEYGSHKFDVTGPGDFSGGNSMHPLDDVRKGSCWSRRSMRPFGQFPPSGKILHC